MSAAVFKIGDRVKSRVYIHLCQIKIDEIGVIESIDSVERPAKAARDWIVLFGDRRARMNESELELASVLNETHSR